MTMLGKQEKEPREVFDYDVNYTAPDLPSDDTIASASASYVCLTNVLDTALALGAVTKANRRVKVWLGAGTDGARYKITVIAVSVGGRTFEDEFILLVKDL